MAQGKLKVKSKVPGKASKKGQKKHKAGKQQVGKIGRGITKVKSKKSEMAAKFNKEVQKKINQSIESELAARAQRAEEGKSFLTLGTKDAKKK